jgi:uncharacterized protein (DUF2237 family)
MLRDDRDSGGSRRRASPNVFGEPLVAYSINPMTGFYRDGCCNTGQEDVGSHTVCVVMTSEFLDFSKTRGNDLSTPVPEFGFPGLILNLATPGAYAHPAGRKHSRQARLPGGGASHVTASRTGVTYMMHR